MSWVPNAYGSSSGPVMDGVFKMDATPTIACARLRLVPFGPDHMTPAYVGWLNDRAVVRYSEQRHRTHTLESCSAYFNAMRERGDHFWAIERTDLGAPRHIGNLSAAMDRPNQVADLAIMIGDREVQGRGFGRDAWVAACEWAIEAGGVRKVSAGCMAENRAMLRLFEIAGMTIEAVRKAHFLLEGRPIDAVYAARFSRQHGRPGPVCDWPDCA
jgi:RimJ/RimL family protein N-acetyltransferase